MALFLSTFVNKIDKKGRVSVPASFRAVLAKEPIASTLIAYPSFVHPCIEASGMQRMERLSEAIDAMDPFSEERDAFAASILGGAVQLSIDGDGRIGLPDSLLQEVEFEDQAVFVGKGQTFEIWTPGAFEDYAKTSRTLAKEKRGALSLQQIINRTE